MAVFDKPPRYWFYLLTFREERNQDPTVSVVWRFSLEDPHTGRRRGLADLETLMAALEQELSRSWTNPGEISRESAECGKSPVTRADVKRPEDVGMVMGLLRIDTCRLHRLVPICWSACGGGSPEARNINDRLAGRGATYSDQPALEIWHLGGVAVLRASVSRGLGDVGSTGRRVRGCVDKEIGVFQQMTDDRRVT